MFSFESSHSKAYLLTWGGEWCIKDACWTSQMQKLLGTWMLTFPLFAEQWNCLKTMGLYVAFKDTMSLLLRSLELSYSWCCRQTVSSPQGGSATLDANHWHWCVHCNTLQFFCKVLDLLQKVHIKGPTKKWWAWTTHTSHKSFCVSLIEFVCTTVA